jgi:Putative heavy-metal-binding
LPLRDAGFRPLGPVQGTSILSLGWQRSPGLALRGSLKPKIIDGYGSYGTAARVYMPKGSLAVQEYLNEGGWTELEERTAAHNDARRQALARLRQAAGKAGALAVVDVRIRRGRFAHAQRTIEFTAVGTAIASDRFELEDDESIPVVSLSGSDFWKLFASGYWPLGLVGGTSIAYIISGSRTKYARIRLSRGGS